MDWKFIAFECELCMYYEICLRHRFYIFRSVDPMLKPFQPLRREFPPQALLPRSCRSCSSTMLLALKSLSSLLLHTKFTDLGNQIDRTGNPF